MATTKKKRPGARTGAKKASAKSAKAAVKKAAPARAAKAPARSARPAKKTAGQSTPAKKRPGRRDPPVPQDWLTGNLTSQQGVLGVTTSSGFVSLETLANAGEKVEIVLQLGPQRTETLRQDARSLLDFIEARADDSMIIIVRCCVA